MRGLVTFMLFALGVNLLMMSVVLEPVPRTRLSPAWGWTVAGAAVLFSIVDVTRIFFRARSGRPA
jgi:hypothetical protein